MEGAGEGSGCGPPSADISKEPEYTNMSQPLSASPRSTDAVAAYILAGGQSSRFGSDKALAQVAGDVQLLRLIRDLRRAGTETHVVADRRDRYSQLGLDCLEDQVSGMGPLAGLVAALNAHQKAGASGWLLLVGCDQVVWRQEWLDQLMANADQACDAVVFLGARRELSQFSDPLPGLYHVRLAKVAAQLLESQRRSLMGLLDVARVRQLKMEKGQAPHYWTFNTPEELESLISEACSE